MLDELVDLNDQYDLDCFSAIRNKYKLLYLSNESNNKDCKYLTDNEKCGHCLEKCENDKNAKGCYI